ncbi:hypothetical protein [Paraferrimonas haliotis]|uniref:hypothetical protein n=1 Tax=Paraferrimonas haliotis TaxID=2013866 RepID=UPI000BA983DD|nr:hypothetical protein [Paraferrimonas haliotis]
MNVLVLTANFAPRAASPAIRTVNLVKGLSAIDGVDVKVLTYDFETLTEFSGKDQSLIDKVPSEVSVERVKSGFLRAKIFKKKRNDQSATKSNDLKRRLINNPLINFLIPDPHIESIYSFYKKACSLTVDWEPDVIISHAYPFSFHLLGHLVKKKYKKAKWIADYGDPWFGKPVAELKTPIWRNWIDSRLERALLSNTDAVTLTTIPALKSYKNEYDFLEDKLHVLPMGYDADDMKEIAPINLDKYYKFLEGKLLFVHTGRIYPEARDPLPFIEALDTLVTNCSFVAERIRVVIVGDVDGYMLSQVRNRPCEDLFTFVDWVPVRQSIAWMKTASLLLLFGNKGDSQIPGKVFQYLGTAKPIFFAQINPDDPTKDLLSDYKDCIICNNNKDQLADSINDILNVNSSLIKSDKVDSPKCRDSYSWSNISLKLYEIIKS